MKKIFTLLAVAAALAAPTASAQYVCTKQGTVLTYAQTIKSGDETSDITEVCRVENVSEADGATVVSLVLEATDSKNPLTTKTETKRYTYKDGITTIYEGDADEVKAEIVNTMKEAMAQQGQVLSESDLQKLTDEIRVRGELMLQIPDDASPEFKNKNKTMRVTIGPQVVTNSMWNIKIEGTESVTTPAGTYDCVKVSYVLKMNMGENSMKINTVDWYAKGIGVVRSTAECSEFTSSSELTKIAE